MALYRIKNITEADYGCEERLDGPHALLRFENGGSVDRSWGHWLVLFSCSWVA